jgi:DNA-binding transcriptional ArsR family regulator
MTELDEVFDAVAAYFSILSEPTRLKIMHTISHEERSVNQIVDEVGATQTNISRHLNLMHRGGVVTRRKDGNQVFYRIADPAMVEICRTVCARIAGSIEQRQLLSKGLMKLIPAVGDQPV